jgi:putative transposase
MPRIPRGQQAGFVYHLINRGNGRATIFHKDQDYQAFLSILALAKARRPVKIFAFSLMPNHFHFVIESSHHQSLSQFMQWLLTSHVRRYHKYYGSSGHVWQGRFKSFPVQRDEHLLMVLRYVLQNPVRSSLAELVGDWPWSSWRRNELADPWPIEVEDDWMKKLAAPLSASELASIRESVNRQRPFGEKNWQMKIASQFGLESTLRPRGRPVLSEMRR